jgi:hypothetical protein
LFGEDGDDGFVIKAFALWGATDVDPTTVKVNGAGRVVTSQEVGSLKINGDAGADGVFLSKFHISFLLFFNYSFVQYSTSTALVQPLSRKLQEVSEVMLLWLPHTIELWR